MLPPEHSLITAAVAGRRHHVSELADAGVNWPEVLRLSRRHAVQPLLLRALRGCAGVPPDTIAGLEAEAGEIEARNRLLARDLLAVLEALRSAGIEGVPFKAPELAEELYGGVSLRPFRDLDVMVPFGDVAAAEGVLLRLGYEAVPRFSPAQVRSYCFFGCDRRYQRGDQMLELHWSARERRYCFPLSLATLVAPLRRVPLLETTVPALSPEDLLLVLTAHGFKHGWEQLLWICDIAFLFQKHPELRAELVLQRAQQLRARRMLATAVLLAESVLGAPAPALLREAAHADPTAARLAEHFSRRLFYTVEREPGAEMDIRAYLRAREDVRDRLGFITALVFEPSHVEWRMVNLPDALFPLYFLLRPARLGAKAARAVLRRASRQS